MNVNQNQDIKYKEHKIQLKSTESANEKGKNYHWKINNLKAIDPEPYMVSGTEILPSVRISPISFSYYKHEGKLDSWKNFGLWVNQLLLEKDELPEHRISYLKELTSNISDNIDKVKAVYQFLQQKTRYVSIQYGIGGYQPLSAAEVDNVGYGDCKALTNYMKAMLKSIGIPSYYTLVKAGRNAEDIDPEFPSQAFNHVILTVPLVNDTVFLECTSQFSPFGFTGSFTDNRFALLVDDNGGHLIRTCNYPDHKNTWNLTAHINLSPSGEALITETVKVNGLQYESMEDELRKPKDEQIKEELKRTNISGLKINSITYQTHDSSLPEIIRERKMVADHYATAMGTRMFLPLNLLNKRTAIPATTSNRQCEFKLDLSYIDNDTIIIDYPSGFEPEFIPAPIAVESVFGSYSSKVELLDNQITYVRRDQCSAGIYAAEKYADYVEFRKKVVTADNQKLVLKAVE